MSLKLKILTEIKPTRILEIGTAVGYSASRFVQFAPEAIVDTIELDEARAKEAIENVKNIGIENQVNIFVNFLYSVKILHIVIHYVMI